MIFPKKYTVRGTVSRDFLYKKTPHGPQRLSGHAIFELCYRISSRKRKKVCKTVFACSYGTPVESLEPQK